MKPIYASFYTPEYVDEAAELIRSLDAFDLDFDVRAITSRGSWVRNCGMKPMFLQRIMADHPGRPLVWLDADARVRRAPSLFDTLAGCDLACHYKDGSELLSGTLYFGSDSGDLLAAWEQACAANPDEWDQRNLQRLVETGQWCVQSLPASYVAIFDNPMCDPADWVISHHQASRRLKRKVSA